MVSQSVSMCKLLHKDAACNKLTLINACRCAQKYKSVYTGVVVGMVLITEMERVMDNFTFNDGGQSEHRSLSSGYCGVRALAIAEGMDWKSAEKHLRQFTNRGKAGNGRLSSGIYKEDYDAALKALGYQWRSAPQFDGRKARSYDLYRYGKVIARQARHFVCVDHGVAHDIWDCTGKMVYGYWVKAA